MHPLLATRRQFLARGSLGLGAAAALIVTDVDELASRANTLIFDEPRLTELSAAAAAFSARQTTQRAVDPIVAQWWSA